MCLTKSSLLAGALIASLANAAPSPASLARPVLRRAAGASPAADYNGCTYSISGVGSFTNTINLDFTSLKSVPSDLTVSTNTIAAGTAPFSRRFMSNNVAVDAAGHISLTVPGGQVSDPILSAEIQTAAKDILYGSVRTVAMASTAAGTTHGFSFYSNDTQEADIAFLTDDNTLLHLTNEQTSYSNPVTSYSVSAPSDATSTWHEYRMDWIPGKTMFYIDGKLVYQIADNVPSTAGFFLWNNWSNGNAWAKGPPQATNTVKIQSIVAYYNRTSVAVDPNSSACQAASAKWVADTQSCDSISAVSSTFNDANSVEYQLQCKHMFVAPKDLSSAPLPSFAQCVSSCDKVKGCEGVLWDGGSGSGNCYFKNLTGSTTAPISTDGFDVAFLSGFYNTTAVPS